MIWLNLRSGCPSSLLFGSGGDASKEKKQDATERTLRRQGCETD